MDTLNARFAALKAKQEAQRGILDEILAAKEGTPSPYAPDSILTYIRTVPSAYRRLILGAFLGFLNPRSAIKAKCQECCGFEDAKSRIKECRVIRCPLHKYRPYQS
jgi:hypothetical protein